MISCYLSLNLQVPSNLLSLICTIVLLQVHTSKSITCSSHGKIAAPYRRTQTVLGCVCSTGKGKPELHKPKKPLRCLVFLGTAVWMHLSTTIIYMYCTQELGNGKRRNRSCVSFCSQSFSFSFAQCLMYHGCISTNELYIITAKS